MEPTILFPFPSQEDNPVMKHIRSVPWQVGDVVPDFVLGRTTCALFLRCGDSSGYGFGVVLILVCRSVG